MARPLLRAPLVALLCLIAWAPAVLAHAELVSATPGPGDTVAGSPAELVANFNQNLDPSRTSIEVCDASGAPVTRGGELGDGPRVFRLALPDLAPGTYEVRWTSFSAEDGELGRGTYTFTVVPASPSPEPTPTPSPSPTPMVSTAPSATPPPASATPSAARSADGAPNASGASGMAPLVAIGIALVVIAGLVFWLTRRRLS